MAVADLISRSYHEACPRRRATLFPCKPSAKDSRANVRPCGAFLAWLAVFAHPAAGSLGPERVLLVVNRNSPESGAIATYYAARRKIPDRQVCLIAAPAAEVIGRDEYERAVEAPVRRCLQERHLEEQIFYLVTTLGVPLHIRGPRSRDSTGASVDSELALLYARMKKMRVDIAGPQANPMFRQTDTPFTHRAFPIFLVTRLAAYDVATVKGMIDRGLAARNRGFVYLDMKEGSDVPGEAWLRDAHIFLPPGRSLLEQTSEVWYGRRNVIGYASWGSNDHNRKRRALGFQWMPGAIATEFVSSNGRTFRRPPAGWDFTQNFAGSPQSLTADLIAEGATGASGHTAEPYLAYTPRPELLFPAYLGGRNLAESYYIAIPAIGWMNIVVGDPLVRLGPP